ncbi:anthranilate synthase component II [Halorussus aquaticus]|uniref:anthranilate synthase n=1 Tax=Halorussus aquaticus TaxID=2953748 RepID=A0ABD5PX51_9EURY|nr:aminodeoxychorismate/anthranilate synthase component II [Halorussus aquaticus]
MSILVIDNYDSFVYNLVQYVGEFDPAVTVRRNDAVTVAEVRELDPDGIVVSPGPGAPAEAGISVPLFERTDYPILGVCLGHQALCAAEGATVGHAPEVVHGKPSVVTHDGEGLYEGLPETFEVGRYHSLAVEREDVPDSLEVTARTVGDRDGHGGNDRGERDEAADDFDAPGDRRGVVMGVRHRERPHVGVQFHPESILTDAGERLVENFCDYCRTSSVAES